MIYRRTNYKLFLKRNLVDLDEHIRRLALATDIFPAVLQPVLLKPPLGNSMLVVAPHQDDEIIGCGGAMLLQKITGKEVHVVFVQDGGSQHAKRGMTRHEMIRVREDEAKHVSKIMKIEEPRFLGYAILDKGSVKGIASALRKEISRVHADIVFVPFFLDYNQDHQMTNVALAEALTGFDWDLRIYCYEVWGLCVPNAALIIDSVMEEKQDLLYWYKSQTSEADYINWVTGLNMYRSGLFPAGTCKYVECFFEMPSCEYSDVVKKIFPMR